MLAQPPPESPPSLIDRELLGRDLDRLAESLTRSILPRVSPSMQFAVRALRLDPNRMVGDVLSRLLDLPDADLVILIDALAVELGAYRRRLRPLEPSPEIDRAVAALVEAIA